MAHFGSKKDAGEWFKFRDKEASSVLAKKLAKEQKKRQAAEKEVERLKKEVIRLNKEKLA